jgi:uncharacterized protein (TIGR03083 family)
VASIDYPDYVQHIREESRRFREVLTTCDPSARVPGCPDWTAADLLWHLAEVQWFWATTMRNRPAAPREEDPGPTRPESYDGLLAAFDEHSAALVRELERADPAEEAWSWSSEQTVGFTYRRQAHEALIHRLDAEQAAGSVTALDPGLAADGVLECLDVMFGGCPPWGEFHPLPHHLRVDCTDTGDTVWVQIGRFVGTNPRDERHYDDNDIRVVADPGVEADAVVEGPAAALDAWLWRRGDDTEVTVHGDRGVYDHFREAVNHPID